MEILRLAVISLGIFTTTSHASSDINICLTQHMPIELYNYGSGQCLSSIDTGNNQTLQMHGCIGGDRFVFHAHRGTGPYKNNPKVFQLVNKMSGKCLTAGPIGHIPIQDTPILELPCEGSSRQQLWTNHNVWNRIFGSAYYQISDVDDKYCLSADESDISIPSRGFPFLHKCDWYLNDQWWLPALGMC